MSGAGSSDRELVQACLAGDERAWSELVERYGRMVFGIARKCGLGDADAHDLLQSVFVILHRRLGTLRDHDLIAGWLSTITRREAIRARRRLSDRPDRIGLGFDPAVPEAGRPRSTTSDAGSAAVPVDAEPGSAVDAIVEAQERRALVRLALRRLGGPCEALLSALFLAQGPPRYDAIAEALGMRIGSIGPTRARCFARLAAILAELGVSAEASEPPAAPRKGSGISDAARRLLLR